jgi:hypothetical protein
MKTGVIGLGAMGAPMARNLHRVGYLAAVWNRTGEKARRLGEELGVRVAADPAELARHCELLILSVSADADLSDGVYGGSVYVAFADTTAPEDGSTPLSAIHSVIRVASSRDGNAPWTVTTPHSLADTETVDRWGPWLRVGPDGVVHVVFYDTRNSAARSGVDLYHSRSLDGGQSWSEPERLTSTVSPNIADGFEFGDYNGLDVSKGNLLGIFTDNRSETGPEGDSVDVYVAGSTDRIFADASSSSRSCAGARAP